VVIVAVAAACGWLYMYTKETKAAPQLGFGQPASVTYIRRERGEYKGESRQSGWAFQDNAGRLRFSTNTTPRCFADVCKKKGDAGAGMRMYVKQRGIAGNYSDNEVARKFSATDIRT
jgi:hypothetical protein